MSPTLDRETFEHLKRIVEHAREQEWSYRWDRHWASTVASCDACDVRFDLSRPVTVAHKPGCPLAASLEFMETWIRAEDVLHAEADDA